MSDEKLKVLNEIMLDFFQHIGPWVENVLQDPEHPTLHPDLQIVRVDGFNKMDSSTWGKSTYK